MKFVCLISYFANSPKKKFKYFSLNVVLKKEKKTHKLKQRKNLQISLHLEYFISTHRNKFHPQIVNILFVVELQDDFEFQIEPKNVGGSNRKSYNMDSIGNS